MIAFDDNRWITPGQTRSQLAPLSGDEDCVCDVETGECSHSEENGGKNAADYDLDDPCPCGHGHTLESCTCPAGHCGSEMP